ncbi:helix-turn-helix transcriptional regulator [Leucobacter sp. W1153]|uniref:helix-turn-helix transcriptional regulator n=1 Tax=Leucobacter sp. W1153 TaxID=3439064 RepID=UPI003F311FE4
MSKILGVADPLLTTAEVARRLGLCRATVCLAVKDGKLSPSMKLPGVNGAYLFYESSVIEWRSSGDRLPGL